MGIMLVIVCRQYLPGTADDLMPGNILGYSCAICGRALQARPSAIKHIEAGSDPLCNPCGFAFVEYMKTKVRLDDIVNIDAAEDTGNKVAETIAELKQRMKKGQP